MQEGNQRRAREQGGDETRRRLNTSEGRIDPTTESAERMRIKHIAKKAYIQVDSGRRVAKALLLKAAPREGGYRVGDLITFQRDHKSNGSNEHANSKRCSPAFRIIDFEGRGDQKKACWVICEGTASCVAEMTRPANNDQLSAYRYLHEHGVSLLKEEQQAYVKLQRSQEATTDPEIERDTDSDSASPDTGPSMPHLSDASSDGEPETSESRAREARK